jgi:hypothetical protein
MRDEKKKENTREVVHRETKKKVEGVNIRVGFREEVDDDDDEAEEEVEEKVEDDDEEAEEEEEEEGFGVLGLDEAREEAKEEEVEDHALAMVCELTVFGVEGPEEEEEDEDEEEEEVEVEIEGEVDEEKRDMVAKEETKEEEALESLGE